MENTLQHYLPLIRFFSLSSDEFIQKVHPYKKLLKHQLYEELLNSYLNSSSEPNDNILLPRYRNIDGIIDSKIVNLNIIALISRWIDKIDINRTEEIIGGYNPSVWKSAGDYSKAKDSFIFSFKSKDNFKDSILSYIKDYNKALYFCSNYGPTFDNDLDIYVDDGCDNKNYDYI
uniref:TLDc domain-containing protein n=1 Tax=Rhizophagus irregularis (strain DAOM 181602 / DAOM 197198 / MUCL 43194) TaxID=747089 RepID=U9SUV3_RHIID